MRRYQSSLRVFMALIVALICALGPLSAVVDSAALGAVAAYAQDVGDVDVDIDGDATPVANMDEGNPTDESGVIDNPVTENPIDLSGQLAMWLAVLGFISTVVISFINRAIPGVSPEDNTKRGVVAFFFCLLVAVADTAIRGTLNLTNVTAAFLIVFSAAVGFYTQWFKNSGFASAIEGRPRDVAIVAQPLHRVE